MKFVHAVALMIVTTITFSAVGQNKAGQLKGARITAEDFKLPVSPAMDSSTNAVILQDVGTIEFTGNKKGWFSYVFKRRTRIRILNKKAFELATVKLSLFSRDEDREELGEVTATTYNLENNQVMENKISKADIFSEKKTKYRTEQKFTLPSVKEGSILEYSYMITSDFYFNIPPWEFQNIAYPVLWSEYSVTIPSTLVYVFDRSGVHPFQVDKASEGHENYLIMQPSADGRGSGVAEGQRMTVGATTINHRWVMKDVPAFSVEKYLTTPRNYLDKIEFQLHSTNNGETSTDVMPNWRKATDELLKREDFGAVLEDERNGYWLDKALSSITSDNRTDLEQARDIYYFIAGNFNCSNHYEKFIATSLQDVYKKRGGNVGELNLMLTAMLNRKHIWASPVLLSTREYGYNFPGYPIMDRLNYVICRAKIDGRFYYLDASLPNLGFGNLSPSCYNGHARIISRNDSASIYLLADSVKERTITLVTILKDSRDNHLLTGAMHRQLGRFESYDLRETVAEKGEQKYAASLRNAANGPFNITDIHIDSLKQPELPVTVHASFNMKLADDRSTLYINPFMMSGYNTNPLTATVRKYPVEMEYPLNETYLFSLEIPEGYEVDELPKMTRVSYNGGEGSFEYLLQKTDAMIQLRCSLAFQKANFDPEEYSSLREFFAYIVKKEVEVIVLKPKK